MGGNGYCPCRYCTAPRRHAGCHASCDEYIRWADKKAKEKRAAYAEKIAAGVVADLKRESVMRNLRKHGRKR